MKRVLVNQKRNTVNVEDVDSDRIYIWKDTKRWYKVQYIGSAGYLSVSLSVTGRNSRGASGLENTLGDEIRRIAGNGFEIFEFDTFEEMSNHINGVNE